MFEELKANIDLELRMSKEMLAFYEKLNNVSAQEEKIVLEVIESIRKRMKILNNSIPELLKNVSLAQKINVTPEVVHVAAKSSGRITLQQKDKTQFLKELSISEDLVKRLRRKKVISTSDSYAHGGTGFYARVANKLFLPFAERSLDKGKYQKLAADLKKSNLNILGATYISMMYMTILVAFILGILFTLFISAFSLSLSLPFATPATNPAMRLLKFSWLIAAIPAVTGILFYLYPGAEKRSIGGKIDQELPFVVIHMGSISGSGIEPLEIFKIIGLSDEYKYTGKEIRKLLNQINIYGYDLVTALMAISRTTPSVKLSEVFSGMATAINSGGELSSFFEKRAETLLLEYRLEREKFTKVAETFMDIYISVVIATPMILLLLLIMISVSGVQVGFTVPQLTILIILMVALINVVFLVFLHLKQPNY